MYRHIRQYCKIANSDEGMEKLMDHTLQKQLAKQGRELAEVKSMLQALVAGGGAIGMNRQLPIEAAAAAAAVARPVVHQVNNGPVTNNTDARHNVVNNVQHVQQVFNQVQITAPWDSDKRLNIGIKDMVAAFAENAKLREFTKLSEHEMADHEIGGPFVVELFMDLVRRAHADPMVRNVYLNPRRTDQVLVYHDAGGWEVFPLPDSIRLLMDGVSEKIRPVILTPGLCNQLPLEAQNALSIAGMLYEESPAEYARKARGLMSAHLANMAPQVPQKG
jgi:hypothetical protein